MATQYVASIEVYRVTSDFWQPHFELEREAEVFSSLTEAMLWLANEPDSYDPTASVWIELFIDGERKVIWMPTKGRHTT